MKSNLTIAGGGLAGLALGVALLRRDVPVTVLEASSYPRHRVCGEFISGILPTELEALGIADLFAPAQRHHTTGWYEDGRAWFRARLPSAAYGLSRAYLDDALAQRFVELGGVLRCGERQEADAEGVVWASGRPRSTGRWLGIKAHVRELALSEDLEIHLQDGGYVGLTRVEGDCVNVCGLFRRTRVDGADALVAACKGAGLHQLAARLGGARIVSGSLKGVSHFTLGWQRNAPGLLCIGDAAAMIPPFTGNGMTMALQSALAAVEPIEAWARGTISWREASRMVAAVQRHRFGRRLRWARILQALMLQRAGRRLALACLRSGLIPFTTLYHKVR